MPNCLLCQEPLPSYATYKQKYCSKEHMWRMNNLKRKGYSLEEIQKIAQEEKKGFCLFCQKQVSFSKKFCSLRHTVLYYYYKDKGYSPWEIFLVSKDIAQRTNCKLCQKPLTEKNAKAIFCTKEHRSFFHYYKNKGFSLSQVREVFKSKNLDT